MPNSTQEPGDLIPTSEVAKLVGADITTVNRWAKAGRLPVAIKGPGRTGANLYDRRVVEQFIADQDVSA